MRKPIHWLALSFLLLALSAPCVAQTTDPAGAAANVGANIRPVEKPITEYQLTPDKLAKAAALYRTSTILFVLGAVYGIGLLVLLLSLKVSARFRDLAERKSSHR